MTAIHLSANDLSPWTARTLETILTRLRGVTRVAMVRSAGLVSVMFDERYARSEDIVAALLATGIEAQLRSTAH